MSNEALNSFVRECNKCLVSQSTGDIQNAMEYFEFRGITKETIKLHCLGYCSTDMILPEEIKNFGSELNKDLGKDFGRDLSYFISGRIIVPVYDEFGEIVGLATRKPTFQSGETWWNLPAPFYKGRHLFLLNRAKKSIFDNNKSYIVEGYMDALYLFQKGLTNVVAIMGTALTARKIALIARYCDNVCSCFDVDKNEAGQIATNKAICQIYKLNFCETISMVKDLPIGEDPDVFVQKNGLKALLDKEKILTVVEMKKMCEDVAMEQKRKILNAKEQQLKFHKK